MYLVVYLFIMQCLMRHVSDTRTTNCRRSLITNLKKVFLVFVGITVCYQAGWLSEV